MDLLSRCQDPPHRKRVGEWTTRKAHGRQVSPPWDLLKPVSQSSPDFLCTASPADLQDARHSYCFPVLPVLLLQRTVSSLFGTTINQTRHDPSHYLKTPTFTTTFCLLASTLPRTCFKNRLCPIEPFRSTVDPCLATRQRQSRPDPARSLQAQPPRSLSHPLALLYLVVCSTSCPCRLHHSLSRQPLPSSPPKSTSPPTRPTPQTLPTRRLSLPASTRISLLPTPSSLTSSTTP